MSILRPGLIIFLLLSCLYLNAQQRCATVEQTELSRATGKLFETTEQFEKALAEKIRARKNNSRNLATPGVPYKIPVVVHVIHNGEALGSGRNIPDEQIISQIEVLNKDFNRLNTDASDTPAEFAPLAGNLNIEFVLAKQDPNHNCTNGIVRVNGNRDQWPLGREAEFKALSYWPAEDYLNIWVIKFQSFLGYAQFPVSSVIPDLENETDNRLTDGVVIDYRVFGSIEAGPFELDPFYNKGRTTTHEVGHFLGLRHIWGDDNGCDGSDFVTDTPNQASETYDCTLEASSPVIHPQEDDCTTMKMFQNYMDYTDDVCMNLFTQGQVDRMIAVLENSARRKTLSESHGLLAPDQTPLDLALTDANFPSRITCADERIDKTPLTLTVHNVNGVDIDEITYSVSVNQGISQRFEVPITFVNNVAQIEIATLSGLALGNNILTLGVWAGCDQTSENNTITFPVTLLDTDCPPFKIYLQENGQSAITFDLSQTSYAQVSVINTVGQEVSSVSIQETTNQTIPLSIKAGVYIMRIRIGSRYYSRKVYLQP